MFMNYLIIMVIGMREEELLIYMGKKRNTGKEEF